MEIPKTPPASQQVATVNGGDRLLDPPFFVVGRGHFGDWQHIVVGQGHPQVNRDQGRHAQDQGPGDVAAGFAGSPPPEG